MQEDIYKKSLIYHETIKGKMGIYSKKTIRSQEDLSLVYTPGVAEPCRHIAQNREDVWKYTLKNNCVAIITDGSAVLGLGNIGPHAALPVMEGKAILFKQFANIDAWPVCLDTQDTQEIIRTVRHISPVFGGINLEDIAAPKCFEVEAELQDLGIPVFHDDQHGTAIVLLAALINASKVVGKKLKNLRVVINGAGAAGIAITRLLTSEEAHHRDVAITDIILCDTKGSIHRGRNDLNSAKTSMLPYTNPSNIQGDLKTCLKQVDVFIGVSRGKILGQEHMKAMQKDPIIFALSNPTPEIMPEEAIRYGAKVVGTGRSDFHNQVNNALVFPGLFRGALDLRVPCITEKMKLSAAFALADFVKNPTPEKIIPHILDKDLSTVIATAVKQAYHFK